MIRIKSRNINSRKNKQNNLNNYEKNTFKLTLENWHFQIWELRIEKLRGNLSPKFFYLNLCLVLYFIVFCSIHADRKDTANENEKSFVLKRREGRRWTIQTAYEPARTTRNGKLGFLCLCLSRTEWVVLWIFLSLCWWTVTAAQPVGFGYSMSAYLYGY